MPLTKWEDGAVKWEQMRDLEDRMGTVTMGVRVEKRAVLIPLSILIDGQGALHTKDFQPLLIEWRNEQLA